MLAGADAACRFEGTQGGYLGIDLSGGRPTAASVEPGLANFTFSATADELAAYLCGRTSLAPFVRAGQVGGDLVALSAVTGTFETALWHSIGTALDPAELAEILRSAHR